jgi:hypothetical protein
MLGRSAEKPRGRRDAGAGRRDSRERRVGKHDGTGHEGKRRTKHFCSAREVNRSLMGDVQNGVGRPAPTHNSGHKHGTTGEESLLRCGRTFHVWEHEAGEASEKGGAWRRGSYGTALF